MMRKRVITIYGYLKQVANEFISDNVLKYSASLAYYTIFSLIPMLIIIIAICGIVFGKEAIQGEIYNQIKNLLGNKASIQIQEGIKIIHLSGQSMMAAIVSSIVLLIGATGIFAEIQDSLNKIWGLRVKAKKIWWKLFLDRLISFSLIVSLGFVLMVSLTINAVVVAIGQKLTHLLSKGSVETFPLVENFLSFFTSVFLFAVIFKVLPDAKIKWKDVMVGAIITSLLFLVGKLAIGYYLGQSTIGSVYGAAGSLMIILVWAYYSSMILYLGAEFTKVYAKDFGGKILPNNYSEWIMVQESHVNNITLNAEVKV